MRVGRVLVTVGAVFAATLGLSACALQPPAVDAVAPTPTSAAEVGPTHAESASQQITFVSVVDGDTIETSAGTVRIIGIDTPERGECGADDASGAIASQLAPGDILTLELPAGENDQDQYGRLIRYATTVAGVDLGLLQLHAGDAVAR